jgi:hypothetical protein
MNKKDALTASQAKSNSMENQNKIDNVSDVKNVLKHSFGKDRITKNIVSSIGLSYGSKKATAFGN